MHLLYKALMVISNPPVCLFFFFFGHMYNCFGRFVLLIAEQSESNLWCGYFWKLSTVVWIQFARSQHCKRVAACYRFVTISSDSEWQHQQNVTLRILMCYLSGKCWWIRQLGKCIFLYIHLSSLQKRMAWPLEGTEEEGKTDVHLQQSQHYESSVWVTFEWFRKWKTRVWFDGIKVQWLVWHWLVLHSQDWNASKSL